MKPMGQTIGQKRTKILFVCYGNICRSPMAAGLAGMRLGDRIEASSAGIAAAGGPAAEEAVMVMRIVYNRDITGHVARNISDYDLSSFDYIVAMDFPIYCRLRDLMVVPGEKLLGWDIEDPIGLGYDAFKATAAKIAMRLEQMIGRLGLDR
jgi:protein-tyrosine-phosphatase